MKCRWSFPEPSTNACAAKLAGALGISPLLAQCLVNRGIVDPVQASCFLRPRLSQLSDPLLLPNMPAAVDRLMQARARAEPLVIFGDYDVDGVTAAALLMETLGSLGWRVNYYLPRRMEEGYGLTREGAEICLQKFPTTLLLAVDCGSTSVDTIAHLREKGTDVIVLDHHQVSTPPPQAVALVNPHLSTTGVGAGLCSAGLAFKLAHALVKNLRDAGDKAATEFDVRRCLDLAALGTIADMVPLTGENRIFATAGLERLTTTSRPGLIALKAAAQCSPSIGGYEVAFQLGPRLNAAGRLEDAEESIRLLLAPDAATADSLARSLDSRNRQRQEIERAIADEVMTAVSARFDHQKDWVIVEGHASWHIGVVGIVASRVVKRFYRPTIILGGDGEMWRGSGRSIEGFDLAAALRGCDHLLSKHGGHSMAAGVTALPAQIDLLRARLNELAHQTLQPAQLEPLLKLDGEVTGESLSLSCVEQLAALSPSGQENPPVQWMMRGLSHSRPPKKMGRENQHLKLFLTDGHDHFEAVWWNCASAPLPSARIDLAFTPIINDYQGARRVQLRLLDWRPAV